MTVEGDNSERNWNTTMLKEYMDQRFDWMRAYLDQRVDGLEKTFETHLQEAREALSAAMVAASTALEAALIANNKAVDAAFAASDKAIEKAETATKERFDSVNEFRGQLRDQAQTMVTRELFEQALRDIRTTQTVLQTAVTEISSSQRELYARTEGGKDTTAAFRANVASIVAVLAVIVAIYALVSTGPMG